MFDPSVSTTYSVVGRGFCTVKEMNSSTRPPVIVIGPHFSHAWASTVPAGAFFTPIDNADGMPRRSSQARAANAWTRQSERHGTIRRDLAMAALTRLQTACASQDKASSLESELTREVAENRMSLTRARASSVIATAVSAQSLVLSERATTTFRRALASNDNLIFHKIVQELARVSLHHIEADIAFSSHSPTEFPRADVIVQSFPNSGSDRVETIINAALYVKQHGFIANCVGERVRRWPEPLVKDIDCFTSHYRPRNAPRTR